MTDLLIDSLGPVNTFLLLLSSFTIIVYLKLRAQMNQCFEQSNTFLSTVKDGNNFALVKLVK